MHQAKGESVQAISERHSEVGEIMKCAYHNIIEDFVRGFSGEKVVNEKYETKEVIIYRESVLVMKEIDLI